jgi:hypothetical protein
MAAMKEESLPPMRARETTLHCNALELIMHSLCLLALNSGG